MTNEIQHLFSLLAKNEATPAQKAQVSQYVFESTDKLNEFIIYMHDQALHDMGINPDDDFMAERIAMLNANACMPGTQPANGAFGTAPLSAETGANLFDILLQELEQD